MNLAQIAEELWGRLVTLFLLNGVGRRPALGLEVRSVNDPHWQELMWFHEYFHGDTGPGVGAGHQTGWMALMTRLIEHLPAK